ncbi:TolC family protein [Paenibacillus sp. SYP-B3998]|uniref:TolC family protein n=1 Tax=Paenibacillus sp. SYP-B3998 TaxID=2678564 RepID=A0A6G4A4B5_9BACL|nr:TolC family protein [Paenibacillus sp. SYP-B3998]NEW09128.1 TolC family protein [Paenibacillus sp. SYP-B3998]
MKKTLISISAALLLFSSSQAIVMADTVNGSTDDPKQNVYVFTDVLETVSSIDLNYVLDRALKDSHNLNLLTLKYAAQGSKKNDLEQQMDAMGSASFTPGHLPNTVTEVTYAHNPLLPPLTNPTDIAWTIMQNTAMNQMLQGMGALAGGMNTIISSQRYQMKTAAHQLGTDQYNSLLQSDEAKAGIRLQTISQYVQLLGQKKQLNFMQEYEAVIEKDLLRATLLAQQGLASTDDVQTVQKAISKQKDEIVTLTNNYRLGLVQLSTDIGISYDPNLVIKDIDSISMDPIVETNTMTLLKNSYQMKTSGNNMDEAVWQSGHSVTSNTYGDTSLGLNLSITGQKNEQTKLELTKKIQTTYNDAQNAYQSALTEQRNLNDVNVDWGKMKFRYSVGVISKHDLNKFELKVHQNETTLAAAKLKYYALKEKAKAMNTGFIQ